MAPYEAERNKIRSGAERTNNRLKEDFGANNVMVKGHSKVTHHLMFGVINCLRIRLWVCLVRLSKNSNRTTAGVVRLTIRNI